MNLLTVFALASAGGILAVWLAYPALIGTIAAVKDRRRDRKSPGRRGPRTQEELLDDGDNSVPAVTIVIATREQARAIRERIEDCLRTSYPGELEIIVAFDARARASVLGAEALFASEQRVLTINGDPPGGKAATLNAGVRAASGDILVFTDTHQRFEPDAIVALVRALQQDPRLGAVSGNLEIERPENGRSLVGLYWRFERWLRRSEARVHSAIGVTGAIYAMRRELWRPLPADLLLDDVYTPMRLVLEGHRVGFAEDARAHETRVVSSTGEYRRKVRTLTGNIQLCVFMPSLLLPWRNPVWLQFLFHKLFRLLTPYLLAVIAAWAVITGAVALEGYLLAVAAVLGLLGMWVFKTRSKFGTSVREVLTAGLLMQSAVVVATVNGVRRRWSVWRA